MCSMLAHSLPASGRALRRLCFLHRTACPQGDCSRPPPAAQFPTRAPLQQGQCVLVGNGPSFLAWVRTPAPEDVWLSQLHFLSSSEQGESCVTFEPSTSSSLWLTNVTTEGGRHALGTSQNTFASGSLRFSACVFTHCTLEHGDQRPVGLRTLHPCGSQSCLRHIMPLTTTLRAPSQCTQRRGGGRC